jgi:hypothetical protein
MADHGHATKELRNNIASILTLQVLYSLIAQVFASLYFGFMMVFNRVDVPFLACQLLGVRCHALAFQLVDTIRLRVDGRTSLACLVQPASGDQSAIPVVESSEVSDGHREALDDPMDIVSAHDALSRQCTPSLHETHVTDLSLAEALDDPMDIVSSHDALSRQCTPSPHETHVTDLSLVETVIGLQGLKAALAANFVADPSSLPDSFRRGYIVDLNQHWISVHAMFDKIHSSLSLIVFDTLEVNYQRYHEVGFLRSSSAEGGSGFDSLGKAPSHPSEDGSVDVVTLCKMRGIQYDISFLAPICDMRRLTWQEEDQIRREKKGSGSKTTIYYDQQGNPFRKIIVQPILQAEQDGTCKSRAFAVLGWLLKLDEKALAWYVVSNRELFQVELRNRRCGVGSEIFHRTDESYQVDVDEDGAIFGSLMSTGKRDKFGRDAHMKVCHLDTLRYNSNVAEIHSATSKRRCLVDGSTLDTSLPCDPEELLLRQRREAELLRIREVLLRNADSLPQPASVLASFVPHGGNTDHGDVSSASEWRAIEDHEARWQFLEETCFFGHNIGFKSIKKKYPRDEVVKGESKSDAMEENCYGFGATKYIRKYMVSNNCESFITHEADPMFHKPLENVLGFLCNGSDEDKVETVPFYVLPFPNEFMALSLENYVSGTDLVLDLEGDHDEHIRQRVSDYSLPSGNNFLNDPINYNKIIANVSLPVKLAV